MSLPRRYWDSSVFLAWLLPEPEREDMCRSVLRAAEEGELGIVTSALTLTEVIKLRGKPELKREHERRIADFFQNEYIILRNVDRFIALAAQRLVWEHNLAPKDSIHVATAIRWKVPVLDTFDDGLIALSGKLAFDESNPSSPLLQITAPHQPMQLELDCQKSSPREYRMGTKRKRNDRGDRRII
jgi:predicted nucleic acid-binding protein